MAFQLKPLTLRLPWGKARALGEGVWEGKGARGGSLGIVGRAERNQHGLYCWVDPEKKTSWHRE